MKQTQQITKAATKHKVNKNTGKIKKTSNKILE
jgi:hypothetical protein